MRHPSVVPFPKRLHPRVHGELGNKGNACYGGPEKGVSLQKPAIDKGRSLLQHWKFYFMVINRLARNFLVAALCLSWLMVVRGENDLYAIFGLTSDTFTLEALKKEYIRLTKEWHPDVNKNAEAESKYQQITYAYSILSDQKNRKIYDLYGEKGLKEQGSPESSDPFDILSHFFGGSGSGTRKRPSTVVEYPVSLESIFEGGEIQFNYQRSVTCPECDGSGAHSPKDLSVCSSCRGTGVQIVVQRMGMMIQQFQQKCANCSGQGKIITKKCARCSGERIITRTEQESFSIPRGAETHSSYILESAGSYGPDGALPGDIVVRITEAPHPLYRRVGPNLYLDRVITLKEALLGFTRTVTSLDGRPVLIERSEPTPPGFTLEVPGQGLHRGPGALARRGSLYVSFSVVFPTSVSPALRAALDQSTYEAHLDL